MPSRDTSLKRTAQNDNGPSVSATSSATNTNILFRTGGAYIPPAKLRMLQEQIKDKKSEDYQRMSWEALKKSINGLINKVNTANIKEIVPELFQENLVRGQGLFCRSLMKAQFNSIPFTPVYASLVGVINSKLPDIGRLLLFRLIHQFRRAYKRNDKAICLANLTFIAHLINHQLVHEILALQILALLLQKPTDDSVEIAVGFMRECGHHLSEVSPKGTNAVFERFRTILHEGDVDKRTQYMIEVLFQVRRDKFKDNLSVATELDLVDEDDQITHNIELDDDEVQPHEELSAFKYDPDYEENEENYAEIRREILGDDESDEDGEGESGSEEEDSDEEPSTTSNAVVIHDKTGTNLVNFRRSIYLTIKSSADFEECAHKLLRIQVQPEDETEFCKMIAECASQERIYNKFYGLLGERFCRLQHKWSERFEAVFVDTYENVHQYETNRIRILAKFFGHLLATDAIPWAVFSVVQLTEDTTTSASRIFLKVLLNEIVEAMGVNQLNQRLKNPEFEEAFKGLFPTDTPKNTRFAINYFTSIGLGALTEELRVQLQKVIEEAQRRREEESDSSSSATDSDSSASESESDSETDSRSRSRSNSRDYRNRSRYRSRSSSPSRSRSPAYRSESRYRSRR